MITATKLIDKSWLLDTPTGKLGLLSENKQGNLTLVTPSGVLPFDDLASFESSFGKLKFKEIDRQNVTTISSIDGYPVHCQTFNQLESENDLIRYSEVEGGIVWLAGYWVYKVSGQYKYKLAIKESKHDEYEDVKGPFKSKMEAQFTMNSSNKEI